jgi:hypothetical protein
MDRTRRCGSYEGYIRNISVCVCCTGTNKFCPGHVAVKALEQTIQPINTLESQTQKTSIARKSHFREHY